MAQTKLGNLLVHAGIITSAQQETCEKTTQEGEKSFEQCLIEQKIVSPDQLAQFFAKYASLPYKPVITDQMADLDSCKSTT